MPAVPKLAPQKVKWDTVRGKLLALSDKTVVPFEERSGGWLCVIVKSRDPKHKVGDMHLFVADAVLAKAKQVEVP